jgi:hypothetical protein
VDLLEVCIHLDVESRGRESLSHLVSEVDVWVEVKILVLFRVYPGASTDVRTLCEDERY